MPERPAHDTEPRNGVAFIQTMHHQCPGGCRFLTETIKNVASCMSLATWSCSWGTAQPGQSGKFPSRGAPERVLVCK